MAHSPLPAALRALGLILEASALRDIDLARRPVHVLPAPSTTVANPVNFRDTRRLIDTSYQLAAQWLAGDRVAASASG
jgi:NTE family protein